MPISSRSNSIPVFSEPFEYFEIGQPFRYEGISCKGWEPEGEIVVSAVDCPIPNCAACDLMRYCVDSKNTVNGIRWIPDCFHSSRKDGNHVIFKKLKRL